MTSAIGLLLATLAFAAIDVWYFTTTTAGAGAVGNTAAAGGAFCHGE